MSANSKIEWTEATWNPVRGCSPVSPGCKNCYAERQAGRFCGEGGPFEGFVQIGKNGDPGPHWTGKVELIPHMLDVPMRTRKPTTFFVNSMSDLFHEGLSPADRWSVFDAMRKAPWHTYQILTKRSKIMCHFMREWSRIVAAPPANWWLGVSVEDQQRKDRIDDLRETPAAVRFLSLEPLLEDLGTLDLRGIDWVIVGGESGPGARPCDIAWIRSIVQQCKEAGVPCFVKQLGAKPFSGHSLHKQIHHRTTDGKLYLKLKNHKGGDPSEWPKDVRVRQMPEVQR